MFLRLVKLQAAGEECCFAVISQTATVFTKLTEYWFISWKSIWEKGEREEDAVLLHTEQILGLLSA